ncbi:barrier-to-autointegration factor-like protein [Dromaius novaehollandiae]|uniref:barrier-to-autointegration factor-like protein n=1 Tax=Dromaius novaehollandiae TaxID=8790 RepID=UPI00311EF49F
MASRSQKFKDFVSEPMGNKTVTEVDGIDENLGSKLAAEGFDKVTSFFPSQPLPALPTDLIKNITFLWHPFFSPFGHRRAPTVEFPLKSGGQLLQTAYILLGHFLLLKKDALIFQQWLKGTFGASSRQALQCATCLTEWCYTIL